MAEGTIEFDRGAWVKDLTAADLPETFVFGTTQVADREKFLAGFVSDLEHDGHRRVTFGYGMLRDLYELAVIVVKHRGRSVPPIMDS